MSLVKHIVARCSANKRLGDIMSDLLSALLIKLTDLSKHEDEMKCYKRPLAAEVNFNFSCPFLYFSFGDGRKEIDSDSIILNLLPQDKSISFPH